MSNDQTTEECGDCGGSGYVQRDRGCGVWEDWECPVCVGTGQPGVPPNRSETPWRVDDLVALINQMAYRLRKADPASQWPDRAADYLKRKGLVFSPLREGSANVE